MLLSTLGVKLVIPKTEEGKVICGNLDPPHIIKRMEEQLQSGTHFIVAGPQHYFSWGFMAACGVPVEIIRKPDAMSDKLTQAAFTAEVMQQVLDNCPPALDPTGTILLLFVIGESMATTLHQGLLDVDRVARLVVGETVVLSLRKYVEDTEKGRLSDFAMHGTPVGNWAKYSNGFIAAALEWSTDYPEQPFYPPALGSIRLETRFSVRRAKTENFGLLEWANHQLSDLAVASLIANGDVRAPSNNKGYVSHEEREMHPNCYKSSPKNVLQTVMQHADQVSRRMLEKKLSINVSGAKFHPVDGVTPASSLTPIELDEEEAGLAEADQALDELNLLAADSRQAEEAAMNITATLSDEVTQAGGPSHSSGSAADSAAGGSQTGLASSSVADAAPEPEAQDAAHLVQATPAAELMQMSAQSEQAEEEAHNLLAKAQNKGLVAPEQGKRGIGVSAAKPCTVQREVMTSSWLQEVEAALAESDLKVCCQKLIDIRKQTMEAVGWKPGMRLRDEQTAVTASASRDGMANKVTLEADDGKKVDPSTLLRQMRTEKAGKYFTFRKTARLARWKDAGEAASGAEVEVAGDESTVQAGEVWLALDGPKRIIPVVVVGANERICNGLRPEVNPRKPVLLKNAESLQFHLFAKEVSTTASGTVYSASGFDFTHEPRVLLHKLAAAKGPWTEASVDTVRTDRTLRLMPSATAKLKKLAGDKAIAAVWKAISPGKKKAATGSVRPEVSITDAMRSAVQAAAARAVAASMALVGK